MQVEDPLPVDARGDLVEFVVWRVGQGVDVGGQARGRGGIDTSDMVVYAYLQKALARFLVRQYVVTEILLLLLSRVTNYLFVGGMLARQELRGDLESGLDVGKRLWHVDSASNGVRSFDLQVQITHGIMIHVTIHIGKKSERLGGQVG